MRFTKQISEMKHKLNIKMHALWAVALPACLLISTVVTVVAQGSGAHAKFSTTVQTIIDGDNGLGIGQLDNNSSCTFTGDPTSNVNLRCGSNPYEQFRETAIAVDPANPQHLLVGANDSVVSFAGHTGDFSVTVGYFVSFDGGHSWTGGRIPISGGAAADPAPAFNRKYGTAHMAHIGVKCQFGPCTFNAEVSNSLDGGMTWGNSRRVAVGQGTNKATSMLGVVNDKPWIVADNNPSSPFFGRLYLTWSRFEVRFGLNYGSPIYMAYSDNAGMTWSSGVEISGADSTYCTDTFGNRCADNQFSTPMVLPSGNVVVHFFNVDHTAAYETPFELDSQEMVVRSANGGRTWSPPVHIADLEDGSSDYPPAAFVGYPTQTGYHFVTWAIQGATVDPVTGDLYAFWADNRDGVHDSVTPVTQTNVFMTKSIDGGATWSGPNRITGGPGDRWMPWAGAYNGAVRVMFYDASYEYPSREHYFVTLATSPDGGASWSYERIDTAPSTPGGTRTIGDYQGMVVDSLGRAHVVWTDMRRDSLTPGRKISDIEYARR